MIKSAAFRAWLLALMLVGTYSRCKAKDSATSPTEPEAHFELGQPFLVASLKTDGTALYAPHAFRTSRGVIFVGYYTHSDGWAPDPFPAALLRSTDDGATWSTLGERGNLGYMFGETADHAVLAVDCQWHEGASGERVYGGQRFAGDQAGDAEALPIHVQGFAKNHEPYFHVTRMIRAPNGSLVTVAYADTTEPTHDMWWSQTAKNLAVHVLCLRSDDEGRNWRLLSYADAQAPTSSPGVAFAVSEPFVEVLSDHRLLCIYRTSTGPGLGAMMQCWSSDSGLTWTKPVSTGLVGVDPCLLQLRNGPLLCSFGRPNVRLMYSWDGGAHWRGQTTLYHYRDGDPSAAKSLAADEKLPSSHAYTSIIALSDDRILYFFDIHQHRIPWAGRLPAEPAPATFRTNSIFALPIRVTR